MKIDLKNNPAHIGMGHTFLMIISTNLWVYSGDRIFVIPFIASWIAIGLCIWLCHYKSKHKV
jgi:hypothetical protein